MSEILHPLYLPFTQEQLRDHFAPVGTDATSADRHLAYYVKSAQAAKDWAEHPLSGSPGEVAKAQKHGLQIQKDERFWVVTALMSIFHAPGRVPALAEMLRRCVGEVPPVEGLATWEQALGDPQQLNLYFEVSLPTPKGYRKYLVDRLPERVLVPYMLESATRTAAAGGALEGATKVDAVGLEGLRARKKRPRTIVPGPAGQGRPSELLERDLTAPAPNRRWVADITYIETSAGFVYAAFILDLFSRMIVGWQVSDALRAELALDALEMAVWCRGDRMDGQLVHHSDRGVQYTAIRYTERLGEISAVRSVGRKGDSYDNAAAQCR